MARNAKAQAAEAQAAEARAAEPGLAERAISAEQERALGLLTIGKTATEAAAGTGISRSTLYRWMRDDPAFVAAWNAWQLDQRQATQVQLLGMAADAVAAVRTALQRGDGRLALNLLKGMGLLDKPPVGSEDPELARKQLDLARREEVLTLQEREFDVMIKEIH